MVDVIAAADAAAGRIDAEHDGLDVLVRRDAVDLPLHEAVVAFEDDAFHGDDGHLVGRPVDCGRRISPGRGSPSRAAHADPGQQHQVQEHGAEKGQDENRHQQPLPKAAAGTGRRRRFADDLGGDERLRRLGSRGGGSVHGDILCKREAGGGKAPFYPASPSKQCHPAGPQPAAGVAFQGRPGGKLWACRAGSVCRARPWRLAPPARWLLSPDP